MQVAFEKKEKLNESMKFFFSVLFHTMKELLRIAVECPRWRWQREKKKLFNLIGACDNENFCGFSVWIVLLSSIYENLYREGVALILSLLNKSSYSQSCFFVIK